MGTYRYWCRTFHELTTLMEWLESEIKRPGCESSISFDQEQLMWCLTLRDIVVHEEDLPF